MRGKPMVLIKDQNGCIVSTSHRLNKDGYLRIRDHRYKCTGTKLGVVSRFPRWIREWKCRD